MFKASIVTVFTLIFSLNLHAKSNKVTNPVVDELDAAEAFLESNSISDPSILLEIDDTTRTVKFPTESQHTLSRTAPAQQKAPAGRPRSLAGAGFTY